MGSTSWSLSEEVIGESADFEIVSFSSLYVWKYTYHITEFTSIINKLDKIEVKIEDENQVLLLLFL